MWRCEKKGDLVSDLYIDGDALDRTKTNVENIEGLLSGPCRAMRDLPAEAAGNETLASKLRGFGDEWDYGMGKLGEFSGACSQALGGIRDAFDGLEDELMANLTGEQG
jgi:hypothetical protein